MGAGRLLAVVAVGALAAVPARAGAGRWTPVGPPGGTVTALAAHPQRAGTFYAGTRAAGVFVSRDGGATWSAANRGIASSWVFDLEVAADAAATVYAATQSGLFASRDGGARWSLLRSAVNELTVAASAPATLYAAAGDVVWRSTDGGAGWERRGDLAALGSGYVIHDLRVHPDDAGRLIAATNGGVALSADGGVQWQLANRGLGTHLPFVREVALTGGAADTLYAVVADQGVWRSGDGGAHWSASLTRLGGSTDAVAVAVDPRAPNVVYAGVNRHPAGSGNVWRSVDAGATWTVARDGPYVHDLAVASRGGRVLAGVSGQAILAGPRGRSLVVANAGLRAAPARAIAGDPHRVGALLAVADVGGRGSTGHSQLLRSTDAGRSWTAVATGAPGPAGPAPLHAIAFDPQRAGRVHAAGERALLRSLDGGVRWRRSSAVGELQDLGLAAALPELVYAVGTRQVPCGIPFCGLLPEPVVMVSDDAGRSWTSADGALSEVAGRNGWLFAVAVDPGRPERAWVAGTGLATTPDSGATWQALAFPGGLVDLAVDPRRPHVLYGAGRLRERAGVWTSGDRGHTWTRVSVGLPAGLLVRRLLVDPGNPARLFAATEAGVFLSEDGAATWRRLGLALAGRDVVGLDLHTSTRTLYAATTSGPGLFAFTLPR